MIQNPLRSSIGVTHGNESVPWSVPVSHPSAWTRSEFTSKADVAIELSAQHLVALKGIIRDTAHIAPQDVRREQFDEPGLNEFLASAKAQVVHGRGIVVIQGLAPSEFNLDELERICWGFGTHWGVAACQTIQGDCLGRVRFDPSHPKTIGYQSPNELTFHSDPHEMLGLMCLQNAAEGGKTQLVSSLSVYNEILSSRPDLLPALFRGFRYATEATGNQVTPRAIPVFSSKDGVLSCMYLSRYMHKAATALGMRIPDDLQASLTYLDEITRQDHLRLEFLLEPGEMLVCHNFCHLHARTDFTDTSTMKRSLLRLWLSLTDGRPHIPDILQRAVIYDKLREMALER
jgi:hypothetical protein